jgi:hypothetical protein
VPKANDAFRAEIECMNQCADRLAAIAKKSVEYAEPIDLLSRNLRVTSANATKLWELMDSPRKSTAIKA